MQFIATLMSLSFIVSSAYSLSTVSHSPEQMTNRLPASELVAPLEMDLSNSSSRVGNYAPLSAADQVATDQDFLQSITEDSEDGLSNEQLLELDELFDELGTDSVEIIELPTGEFLAEIDDGISEGTIEGVTGLNLPNAATSTRDSCSTSTQGVYVRKSTGKLATKPTSACTHRPRSVSFIVQLRSWGVFSPTLRYTEKSPTIVPVTKSYTWMGMQGMKCASREKTRWQAVNVHFITDYKGCKHYLMSRSGTYSRECRHA
ncbi:hypothetical protein [Flaviflexus huanghaiensis]|uniref:hypothetical protein n=1 Tax=Flaviflexus huanghaiensis TaxID=1111473 RepID=UPI0015FBA6FA|nr:hypothetical protein [Flaviflexus huanghaiensis]